MKSKKRIKKHSTINPRLSKKTNTNKKLRILIENSASKEFTAYNPSIFNYTVPPLLLAVVCTKDPTHVFFERGYQRKKCPKCGGKLIPY